MSEVTPQRSPEPRLLKSLDPQLSVLSYHVTKSTRSTLIFAGGKK